MNGVVSTPSSSAVTLLTLKNRRPNKSNDNEDAMGIMANKKGHVINEQSQQPYFMTWTTDDFLHVARYYWLPCVFAAGLLFFMAVEYTLRMIPSSSPPFDLGFIATRPLHRLLSSSPQLNTFLAALNTVPFLEFLILFFNIFLNVALNFNNNNNNNVPCYFHDYILSGTNDIWIN